MKNPAESNFKLSKVKILPEGGLMVEFGLTEVNGAETYGSNQIIKSAKIPHPDLTDRIYKMAQMVVQVYGFTSARDVVFAQGFGANVSQKDYISKYVDEIVDRIRVNGFSVSGEGPRRGVVITATFAVDNRQRVAINTSRILLENESRGFEEKLTQLVNEVEKEVYEFVYRNKIAAPELFPYHDGENEEPEEIIEVEDNVAEDES